jgi:hypothetical protein
MTTLTLTMDTHFLAFISDSMGANVMVLLGILVAIIVGQQFLLAKEKFKLDMFEKRFAVFNTLNLFIADTVVNSKVTAERIKKFNADTRTASFLFGDDIINLIEEVKKKGREMRFLDDTLQVMGVGGTRQKLLIEKESKKKELVDLGDNLRQAFLHYLKFKKWKHELIMPDFIQDVITKMQQ